MKLRTNKQILKMKPSDAYQYLRHHVSALRFPRIMLSRNSNEWTIEDSTMLAHAKYAGDKARSQADILSYQNKNVVTWDHTRDSVHPIWRRDVRCLLEYIDNH